MKKKKPFSGPSGPSQHISSFVREGRDLSQESLSANFSSIPGEKLQDWGSSHSKVWHIPPALVLSFCHDGTDGVPARPKILRETVTEKNNLQSNGTERRWLA